MKAKNDYGKTWLNDWLYCLAGVWVGAIGSIILCRYITIPPMPWLFVGKIIGLAAVLVSLILGLLCWMGGGFYGYREH